MRKSLSKTMFGAIAALLLLAAAAHAAPRDEVFEATSRMAAASSYVIHIHAPESGMDGEMEMHYVAPDRYRMIIPGLPAQTIIGNQMYMEMGGRTMRMPMPSGTLDRMQDQAKIREAHDNARIESLGSDVLDGKPASKYRIVHADQPDAEVTLWVGGDGWPMQMQVDARGGAATMRYSRFNAPSLRIPAPD
ncbi:MAG: hypothetical protein GX805_10275 [Gammaproteobacteria bacterium]|nr:hypothetical protein [Gammaproteobacteria bacterium]